MASNANAQDKQTTPWFAYKITQGFKWTPKNPKGHSGIDIGCPLGTPVTAPVAGQIVGATCHKWGIQVDIKFTDSGGNVLVVSFLHLMQLAAGIQNGQVVQVGTLLGYTGGVSSGVPCPTERKFSSGAHLHFELTHGPIPPYTTYNPQRPTAESYPINPLAFLASIRASGGAGATDPTGPTPISAGQFADQAYTLGLGGDAEDADPGAGATAAALLVEVPGFFGICAALDVAEQFTGYKPPTGITGAIQVPGYTTKWVVKNFIAFVLRMTIWGIGAFLFVALIVAALNINKWLQEAGGIVLPLAISAL